MELMEPKSHSIQNVLGSIQKLSIEPKSYS